MGEQTDSDAGCQPDLLPIDGEGFGERCQGTISSFGRILSVWKVCQQDRKLVPSKSRHRAFPFGRQVPRNRIAFSHTLHQPFRDHAEKPIAGPVAQRLVDPLVAIQIQQQHSPRFLVPRRRRQGLREPVVKQPAVGEMREVVVEGQELYSSLALFTVRDVLKRADQTRRPTDILGEELKPGAHVSLPAGGVNDAVLKVGAQAARFGTPDAELDAL